jgi:hypothetical protein
MILLYHKKNAPAIKSSVICPWGRIPFFSTAFSTKKVQRLFMSLCHFFFLNRQDQQGHSRIPDKRPDQRPLLEESDEFPA